MTDSDLTSDEIDYLPIIIGVSTGGAVLVLLGLLIVCCWCCCRYYRRYSTAQTFVHSVVNIIISAHRYTIPPAFVFI